MRFLWNISDLKCIHLIFSSSLPPTPFSFCLPYCLHLALPRLCHLHTHMHTSAYPLAIPRCQKEWTTLKASQHVPLQKLTHESGMLSNCLFTESIPSSVYLLLKTNFPGKVFLRLITQKQFPLPRPASIWILHLTAVSTSYFLNSIIHSSLFLSSKMHLTFMCSWCLVSTSRLHNFLMPSKAVCPSLSLSVAGRVLFSVQHLIGIKKEFVAIKNDDHI